jgi:hypothetical protein
MASGTRPPIPPSYYRRSPPAVRSGTRTGLPLWHRLPWVRTRAARWTVAAVGVASALLALTIGLAALTGPGERSAPPPPPVGATPSQPTAASPGRPQAATADEPSPTPAATATPAATVHRVATPAQGAHASRPPAASEAASPGAASSDPGGTGTGRSGVPPGLSRHPRSPLPSPPQ